MINNRPNVKLVTLCIRTIYFILVFSTVSCTSGDKSFLKDEKVEEILITKKIVAGVDQDPTFEKSLDTISEFGPHSITRNVLHDRNGTIWLASWEGIIGYDGKFFTNYTLKAGLRQFHVCSILEDRSGNLWFGTIGAGVYKYDGIIFTNITTADHLAGNTVFCMLEDNTGTIWFGTDQGASSYNGNSFINFTTHQGLIGNSIQALEMDKHGNIWFGTHTGLSIFKGGYFTNFDNENEDYYLNVRTVYKDRTGNIWISSREGLSLYDGKDLTKITTSLIGNIFEDRSGTLWFSGGGANSPDIALSKYDGKSFIKVISKNDKHVEGLRETDKQVFGLTEDRAGNIWFGTAGGVCKYDGRSFTNFSKRIAS